MRRLSPKHRRCIAATARSVSRCACRSRATAPSGSSTGRSTSPAAMWPLITEEWINETHQMFLTMIRSHWRGWNIVLFEDRASQHKSPESLAYAEELGIEVRLLPRATPELNAMDHLWRQTKRETVGSRATRTVADSALCACQYIIALSPRDRLRQAGILSGNFWLME